MTTWAVIGDSPDDGLPVKVAWDGEKLLAKPTIMQRFLEYCEDWGVVGITPTGPWIDADLSDELAASLVVESVLIRAKVIDGELPALPPFAQNPNTVY